MTDIPQTKRVSFPLTDHPLRHETLVMLRWLAIIGQTACICYVHFVLKFPMPFFQAMILVGMSVVLNIALMVRYGPGHRPGTHIAFLQLAYDSIQMGGLLFLTGGLANPFSILLLAPISVSASTLPARATATLGGLIIVVASIVGIIQYPLPWDIYDAIYFPPLYIFGFWAAIVCGVGFIASYTTKVAYDARRLVDALTATELALSRQQQLTALDGLAAAAAHELGTPLATINLAAKEIRRDISEGELADDIDLILEQVARCRAILGKLRNLQPGQADIFESASVTDIIAELAKPHENSSAGVGKEISYIRVTQDIPEPIIPRNVALLYGIGNLIENAVQFAEKKVTISASWDEKRLLITITDDGPGFPPDLLSRIGEPYLTTKGQDRGRDPRNPDAAGGLGLGVFIAKTLLERTGARLRFFNARSNGHACIEISWPHNALIERLQAEL